MFFITNGLFFPENRVNFVCYQKMEKKRITFIVNPISGTKRKDNIVQSINKVLNKDFFEYEILYSEYAGQAGQLSSIAASEGKDIVVAVGGDGTVNEVAGGLIGTETALGIIPCGSGNGLARHLQIPLTRKRAVEIINQCSIEKLDYGKVCGEPFFCTCGMGFDAYVSYKFTEAKKRGVLTYLEQALTEWLRYKPETYIVEDETGSKTYKAFLITCANASEYGNNAYIAPQASMNDGLMDVTVIEPFKAFEAPQLALQLFSKTLHTGSYVQMFRTNKISIHRSGSGVIHRDGDPMFAGENVNVEIVHKGINVVINPNAEMQKETILQSLATFAVGLQEKGLEFTAKSNPLAALNKNFFDKFYKK